ncbi:MAG: c-type cytochrome [Archangium sp.]
MKQKLLGALVGVALAVSGCQGPAVGGGSSASGSVGITRDDALVYAADADLDRVFVLDTRTREVVRTVKVGRQPEKVLVGSDDTVYVTNRLERSVSIIRRGEDTEAARINTAVEPVGLALSADNKTLYVVNATSLEESDFGTLMAFDTATLSMKWETPVGQEPRGITMLGEGKVAVSLYKQGDLVLVDAASGKLVRAGTDLYEKLNATSLGIVSPGSPGSPNDFPTPEPFFPGVGPQTGRARGMEALTVSPDGKQIYVASLIATDTVLQTATGGGIDQPISGGSGYGGGSCGTTAVASAAILTFDGEGNAQVDDLRTCTGTAQNERPPMMITTPVREMPIQGPRAIALDTGGRYLYVANFESNNVAIVKTTKERTDTSFGRTVDINGFGGLGSVEKLINVGNGPTGIALASDGKSAWVFNSFDHSLTLIEGDKTTGEVRPEATVRVNAALPASEQERYSADELAGRRLFFSATDARMNNPATGISCGTCHLEGREDGHVWNFPDGPRQTPSLQGRKIMQTAPFHWNGEFANLQQFMTHTVSNRMGGSGVTASMEKQLGAFIDSMPQADNPHRTSTPEAIVNRGRAAFEKAECNTCHGTDNYTDNTFADVGTYVTAGPVVDDMRFLPNGGLNTPSLLGLARTAPFLHDGSAQTLKARILNGKAGDKHGRTSVLNDGEVDDLVAYLKTL